MGQAKDMLFEQQEQEFNMRLANYLGISEDDLSEIEYEIDRDASEGGVIYSYIFVILNEPPQEILDKISELEQGKYVYINTVFFESEDE